MHRNLLKKRWTGYYLVNTAVLLITLGLFIRTSENIRSVFRDTGIRYILILMIVAYVVHVIKAGRLYLILYGIGGMTFPEYLKMYCMITPVSMVLPFKLGEFFRMYYYGKQLDDPLKGIIIICLDRFMDTIALMVTIFLVWMFNGGNITFLIYFLLLFLLVILVGYFTFPGVCSFWKKYILKAKATEEKLALLRALSSLEHVYQEITDISTGKGMVLCFLSLLAWTVETGSFVILNGIYREDELSQTLSVYLLSAIGIGASMELKQFVFLSVLLMITIYFVIKILEALKKRRTNR